ncbi:MAG TPA: HAMP domain-containing sensor histidine kinase, partial [Kiloniellaceae bacterium]|nr:HAMP domain-containing sensor histidine kinase [Kiloniellaceae bacterium]
EELTDSLASSLDSLDTGAREDADDLLETLRENLEKIANHGRRADSIVKNMLAHSREGPSELQPTDVNALAQEAMNLAYHGARAENSSFNADMKSELAPDLGQIQCYPQDLMRVFLNLFANAIYAANKRKAAAGKDFLPEVTLTSRDLGDAVALEVRDNGIGIAPEDRDKLFTPFFTTKPAGEGTGLGLSLSYDIVVKQHGGNMTVDSEPDSFTAFTVTLPRRVPCGAEGVS